MYQYPFTSPIIPSFVPLLPFRILAFLHVHVYISISYNLWIPSFSFAHVYIHTYNHTHIHTHIYMYFQNFLFSRKYCFFYWKYKMDFLEYSLLLVSPPLTPLTAIIASNPIIFYFFFLSFLFFVGGGLRQCYSVLLSKLSWN